MRLFCRIVDILILCFLFVIVAPASVSAEAPSPAPVAAPGKIVPAPAPAPAALNPEQADQPDNNIYLGNKTVYQKSLRALTMLFVLAVLLENAFAIIFNWPVYLTYFDQKGTKTIIMIVVAYAIVALFHMDIVASLIDAYGTSSSDGKTATHPLSELVTALILAGGSSGVYNIMHALGYRNDRPAQELQAKPPADRAWVAIRVTRKEAVGDVFVRIEEVEPPAGEAKPDAIAGTVGFLGPRLKQLLMRNFDRFPQNGGHTVDITKVYRIYVEGRKANGEAVFDDALRKNGPLFRFAGGAIVDLEAVV